MKFVLLEDLAVSSEVMERLKKPLLDKGHEFIGYKRNDDVQVQITEAQDADAIIIGNMPL